MSFSTTKLDSSPQVLFPPSKFHVFSLTDEAREERREERSNVAHYCSSKYGYLSLEDQLTKKLSFHDGNYYQSEDKLISGKFLYVILLNFNIICMNENETNPYHDSERYMHSCLANGKKVLAAGIAEFNEGQLIWLSNESGHYKPEGMLMQKILKWLHNQSQQDFKFIDHSSAESDFIYQYNVTDFIKYGRESKHERICLSKDEEGNAKPKPLCGVYSRYTGVPALDTSLQNERQSIYTVPKPTSLQNERQSIYTIPRPTL